MTRTNVNRMIHTGCILGLIAMGVLILGAGNTALARDAAGCLTCHRYPGMVSYAEADQVKVLHIDEIRYGESSHGQFECTQCHTDIHQVPHTGRRSVDCTTSCHQGEDADPLPPDYPLAGFHAGEQSYILQLEDGSSCRACHQLYPHRENNLVRGFLNMHTGFMMCTVCHLKNGKFKTLRYRWRDLERAVFQGRAFGTFFHPSSVRNQRPQDAVSRIEAYHVAGGQEQDLNPDKELSAAKRFLNAEPKLSVKKRASKLKYFHRDIERKEVSATCGQCHASSGILDYMALGYSAKKAKRLININLKGLVTKYRAFHLPQIFDR